MSDTDVANGNASSKRVARSKRLAFDAQGNDTNDLTEAVSAAYVVLDGEKNEVYRLDYTPQSTTPYGRAAEIFGFHTHAGNWANTGWNTLGLEAADMPAHMAEYAQMIEEGGWTNRQGDATAGAGIYIDAYVRMVNKGKPDDALREKIAKAWAEKWDDDAKDAIKKDDHIKAFVAQIRAERAAEKAKGKKVALPTFE